LALSDPYHRLHPEIPSIPLALSALSVQLVQCHRLDPSIQLVPSGLHSTDLLARLDR
jgi:hypothetical protein